jgi:hypothetical protein
MKTAKEIMTEIKAANLEYGKCAYVTRDGEWTVANSGCQPGHTQAIGPENFDQCCDAEIEDDIDNFLNQD